MAEQSYNSKVKIFALNSNKPLAKKIADAVGSILKKVFGGMKSSSSNQHLHRLMTI